MYPVLGVTPILKRYVRSPLWYKGRASWQSVTSSEYCCVENAKIMGRSSPTRMGEDSKRCDDPGETVTFFPGVQVAECQHRRCQELGRSHIISEHNVSSSVGITLVGKSDAMWCEKSDEAIVPMMARTTQPCLGKGLYFGYVRNGGTCA